MKNRKMLIIASLISIIFIMLVIFNWKMYKKLRCVSSRICRLEYNLGELQKNWLEHSEAGTKQLKAVATNLENQFNELANSIGHVEATEPGYQLRATLRLASLAAMELALNKEEPLASELLKQAINKLIKLNDPRLNPVLYNIQDEYNYLLEEKNAVINSKEVFNKIDIIQCLLKKLSRTESSEVEMNDLFTDSNLNNPINKISYLKIEVLNIYLEQLKLAFAQNNDTLYQQALSSINSTLKLILWAPDTILQIQEQVSWLANVKIRNYSLLLQAILNLEDLL